jgi:uncharacterized damage-inducible protein DinB
LELELMLEHLRRLFSYDDWANREVLAGFPASGAVPSRALQLMAHIFAAERLWLERLLTRPQSVAVWPDFDLQRCRSEAAEMPRLWKEHLQNLGEADLARTVTYRNSKGEVFTSRVEDILQHVLMHSAYHRGQIALTMRDAGLTPAYTDFIHAVRGERI